MAPGSVHPARVLLDRLPDILFKPLSPWFPQESIERGNDDAPDGGAQVYASPIKAGTGGPGRALTKEGELFDEREGCA